MALVREAALRKQRKAGDEQRKRRDEEEKLQETLAQSGPAEIFCVGPPLECLLAIVERVFRLAASFEQRRGAQDAGRRHHRRQVNGRRQSVLRGEIAGQRRPDEESDAECDANQPERLRALARLGVIRDVRLRQREIPGCRSVEHARDVEHPERLRARHHDEADEGPDLADEEHRLPADAIRHVTDDGTRHELARREDRHEHRRLQRRRVESLRVNRQQRNDERHAEDIDQNDEENGKERNAL